MKREPTKCQKCVLLKILIPSVLSKPSLHIISPGYDGTPAPTFPSNGCPPGPPGYAGQPGEDGYNGEDGMDGLPGELE